MKVYTDHRVGARIQRVRLDACRDRRWLAERLHETLFPSSTIEWIESNLEDIEKGDDSLSLHATDLAAIARALGCSLLYLLGVDDG